MPLKTIRVTVEGGQAKPTPPLGPTLSQLGLNVGEVVKRINDATSSFKGMTVPVTIEVNTESKEYRISVGVPTTTALLLKAANAQEPSGDPAHKKIGDIGLDGVIEVALMKRENLTARTLKGAVLTILGTAKSIGLTVNGRDPKDLVKEVKEGKLDEEIRKFEEKWVEAQ